MMGARDHCRLHMWFWMRRLPLEVCEGQSKPGPKRLFRPAFSLYK
jgi:hypothetical protein